MAYLTAWRWIAYNHKRRFWERGIIALLCLCASAFAAPVPLIGIVQYPDGRLFNGYALASLVSPGQGTGGCIGPGCNSLIVNDFIKFNIINGSPTPLPNSGLNVQLIPNDQISPQSAYRVDYFTFAGVPKMVSYIKITGTAAFDLGGAPPLPINLNNIMVRDLSGLTSISVATLSVTSQILGGTGSSISGFTNATFGTTIVTTLRVGASQTMDSITGTGGALVASNAPSITNIVLLTGVANDVSGFKHLRGIAGCATAASAGATCDTTVTWVTAFADALYTVQCSGDAITSGIPVSGGVNTKAAGSVKFRTVAATAAAAQFTNIECTAVHD